MAYRSRAATPRAPPDWVAPLPANCWLRSGRQGQEFHRGCLLESARDVAGKPSFEGCIAHQIEFARRRTFIEVQLVQIHPDDIRSRVESKTYRLLVKSATVCQIVCDA